MRSKDAKGIMLTLKATSLDWAQAHAMKYGDTDVFPLPFEYEAIQFDWTNIKEYLQSQDVLTWTVRQHRTLLAPKAKYGFRVVTQLDPLDFIVFAAAVKEIAADLEASRILTSKHIIYSYRYAPTKEGRLFDPTIGFGKFQSVCKTVLERHPEFTHIASTDISDFYSRIYHHRLENALYSATDKGNHVKAIMNLLSGWNGTETFGIPVGSAPARLLAETTISDIDEALLANDVKYVRFNDDFRIFAKSHSEAYRQLAFLADILFKNHGLNLQQQKTTVLQRELFEHRYLSSPEDRELSSLQNSFRDLLGSLGISDPYQTIEYGNLSDEAKEVIDSLNLFELFQKEIESGEEPDLPVIRFVLRRLGQLGDPSVMEMVLEHLDSLHPAFPDIIRYLSSLRGLDSCKRSEIGTAILDLLNDSILSELDYHRLWALELFSRNTDWNNESRFFQLLSSLSDQPSRRKIILAMGRAGQRHWFKSRWRSLFEESPWPRRALLAGASCMPPDARKHWYKSVESRLDPLEKAIMRWCKQHPFVT